MPRELKSITISCAELLASGLGSGCARLAPGTWGTLAAVAVWLLAQGVFPSSITTLILLALASVVGLLSVTFLLSAKPNLGIDPQWIVIDEWAGVYLALVVVPCKDLFSLGAFFWIVSAIVLFRILDIGKPGPVAWAESLPGAWGIMADDLIAGAIAAGVLSVVSLVTI
jgi:phosphatidylglycerophosphatase A